MRGQGRGTGRTIGQGDGRGHEGRLAVGVGYKAGKKRVRFAPLGGKQGRGMVPNLNIQWREYLPV